MKIGIYLGDVKNPESIGDLTFELSFIDELLSGKTNHDFTVYYYGKNNLFKNTKNIHFKSMKYFKKPEISIMPFKLKSYKTPFCSFNHRLKKDKINVVFFLVPYLHEHIEIPYYAVIRDVAHRILPHFPEFNNSHMFERLEKKLNLFLSSASKIITCNKIAKNDIKTLYDVIEENIITKNLPYPNWLEKAKPDNSILRNNFLEKNSYIFYPAQFWTHKNHIRLVHAAKTMQEQNINLKVVFSGMDKGNKEYLINETKKLNLEENIVFLDYVNHNELAALYKNAYALCYPSLAGPDSIVALEAMYFNCPVLISNHLGYNEQLKTAALYFNPLDEFDIVEKIKMLNDIAFKDEIIAKGSLLIKENSTKKYVDNFLNIMDSFYLTRMCWSLEDSYQEK